MIQRTDTDARVGANIKALREAKGWSHWQCGRQAGMHGGTVAKYEAGDRPLTAQALARFAHAFGVTKDELCGAAETVTEIALRQPVRHARPRWKHDDRAGLDSPAAVDVLGAVLHVEETDGELRISATILRGYDSLVINNALAELGIRVRRLGYCKTLARDVNPRGDVVDEEDEAA